MEESGVTLVKSSDFLMDEAVVAESSSEDHFEMLRQARELEKYERQKVRFNLQRSEHFLESSSEVQSEQSSHTYSYESAIGNEEDHATSEQSNENR